MVLRAEQGCPESTWLSCISPGCWPQSQFIVDAPHLGDWMWAFFHLRMVLQRGERDAGTVCGAPNVHCVAWQHTVLLSKWYV